MPNYEVWVYHSEEFPRENVSEAHNNDDVEYDRMDEMLQDLREDLDSEDVVSPKKETGVKEENIESKETI
jgi:hypothetical protein